MITLLTLKWDNCFSYGASNELKLNEDTVTQIIGTNGVGKSSIPQIIEEVLYNKNSKGIKKVDIPNRYIKQGYYIYLSFTKDSDLYEITTDRKTSIKVKLEKNGEDISSHTATNTYKTLQEIIGIDFKTFSQLVYQNTNASLQFLTATDTNRKKFLIDLLHLEEYTKLFEIFKEASRVQSLASENIKAQIATVQKWLENNKLDDTTILPMLKLEINTDEEEKEFRQLTKEIENISEKNKNIVKNNQYKDLLKQINLDEAQRMQATEIKPVDFLQELLGLHGANKAQAEKVLQRLEGIGLSCPTCQQDIDSTFKSELVEAEKATIKEEEAKLEYVKGRLSKVNANNNEFRAKTKIIKDWEDLYRSIDGTLPSRTVDKKELEESLDRVRADLQRAKNRMADTAKENEKRSRANTRIQVIQEQTEKFLLDLQQAQETLTEQDTITSNLEVLKKAFSTNGLLAYKIENLVKELEELVNKYLAELSDGRFTLEFVVSNDKLNVQITDNGILVDILALSSGELARVNTATLIAIRKLMSSISKSRINILFLDEVINVLDDTGREKLVEVLIGEEDLNTYVVSHQWEHPLLTKLTVIKEGEASRIEE